MREGSFITTFTLKTEAVCSSETLLFTHPDCIVPREARIYKNTHRMWSGAHELLTFGFRTYAKLLLIVGN
jgi:hypothetical protein